MTVPSIGFIAGPDVSQEEAAMAKRKVAEWSRSHKLVAFSHGADRISKTLKQFPRSMWMFKPSKEKWCIGEILWHLADQEANLYVRLRRAIAESGSVVSAYDQNKWAKNLEYILGDFEEAWEILKLLRRSNSALLKRLPVSVWKLKVKHPERGLLTVESLVSMNVWHLEHHLGQMEKRYRDWKFKKRK
jgi:hypothetical protein